MTVSSDSPSNAVVRPRRIACCCRRPRSRARAVAGGDEDAVTLAAEAALPLLARARRTAGRPDPRDHVAALRRGRQRPGARRADRASPGDIVAFELTASDPRRPRRDPARGRARRGERLAPRSSAPPTARGEKDAGDGAAALLLGAGRRRRALRPARAPAPRSCATAGASPARATASEGDPSFVWDVGVRGSAARGGRGAAGVRRPDRPRRSAAPNAASRRPRRPARRRVGVLGAAHALGRLVLGLGAPQTLVAAAGGLAEAVRVGARQRRRRRRGAGPGRARPPPRGRHAARADRLGRHLDPYVSGPRSWRERGQDLRLEGARCGSCGRLVFPYPRRARTAAARELAPERLARTGTVVTAHARPRLSRCRARPAWRCRARRRRPLLRAGRAVGPSRDRAARPARAAPPAPRRRRRAVLLEGDAMPIAGEVAIVGAASTAFGVHHDRGYLDLLAEAATGARRRRRPRARPASSSAWLGTAEPGLTGPRRRRRHRRRRGDRLRPAPGDAGRQLLLHRPSRPCAPPRSTSPPASTGSCSRSAPRRCATSRAAAASSPGPRTSPTRRSPRAAPRRASSRCSPTATWPSTASPRETLARSRSRTTSTPPATRRRTSASRSRVEEVLAAPLIAEPFGTLDCTPTTDGAAARPARARRVGARARRPLRRHPRLRPRRHERLLLDLLRPETETSSASAPPARRRRSPTRRRASPTRASSSTWSSATTASPSPSSSTTRTSGSAAAARAARCSRAARRPSAATSRSTSPAASSRAATRSGRRACG